jgi:hypothetical protein
MLSTSDAIRAIDPLSNSVVQLVERSDPGSTHVRVRRDRLDPRESRLVVVAPGDTAAPAPTISHNRPTPMPTTSFQAVVLKDSVNPFVRVPAPDAVILRESAPRR